MKKFLIFLVPLALAFPVYGADVTVCKHGKTERRVEVGSTSADKPVPCEVKYFKEGETDGKVLWSAQNEADYCSTKGKEFVEKLTSLGWECAAEVEKAAEPPAK